MNAIEYIRQWCLSEGYAFGYGTPYHINRWMGETDFAASRDGVAVYAYLLTESTFDGQRDQFSVGVYFARLCDFDFDEQGIDSVTEDLRQRSKALLQAVASGNSAGWSGARWQYGYDDYAENVVWCCLRVTLTALAAECEEPVLPAYNTAARPGTALAFLRDIFGAQDAATAGDVAWSRDGREVFACVVADLPGVRVMYAVGGVPLQWQDTDTLVADFVLDDTAAAGLPGLQPGDAGRYLTLAAFTLLEGTHNYNCSAFGGWELRLLQDFYITI